MGSITPILITCNGPTDQYNLPILGTDQNCRIARTAAGTDRAEAEVLIQDARNPRNFCLRAARAILAGFPLQDIGFD